MTIAGQPLDLGPVRLRNRLVATAHASGLVQDGLPVAGDDRYWGRIAAGGAAMLISGGTVTAPESSPRRGNILEAWRPESVEPLRRRVNAIHAEGGVAVCQLVHLGRETLGAETYFSPVAPAPVRSPREPTAPRGLLPHEVDDVVEGFRVSAGHALDAGFDGIELHAAHAYLLEQFLSPRTNPRGDGIPILERIIGAIRGLPRSGLVGVRFSVDASEAVALMPAELETVVAAVDPIVDWVNLTVGVRTTYVRDMATTRPPLLDELARVRALVRGPLLVSHAFRDAAAIEEALAGGADLVGMARPLIADPDFPRKLIDGRAGEIRPCVACNEDCRLFDPLLLCTVNPDLAPPDEPQRPAAPLARNWKPDELRGGGRVAVVGAGPAGLECSHALAGAGVPVVLFEAADHIGGQLATAAAAPNRKGWRALLEFYERALARSGVELRLGCRGDDLDGFDAVVVATGAEEAAPTEGTTTSTALNDGPTGLQGTEHVVVIDDGFGWWPALSAVELALAAKVGRVTLMTPGTAFAGGIPTESRVQLLQRLRGTSDLQILPMVSAEPVPEGASLTEHMSGRTRVVKADRVIVAGERRPRGYSECTAPLVLVIGDAVVPRRAAHAIAEGRAAATRIAAAVSGHLSTAARSIGDPDV